MKKFLILNLILISTSNYLLSQSENQTNNINLTEIMMHNTFLISGDGSCGTAFILGKENSVRAKNKNNAEVDYSTVLITAAHVLDSM